nr:MAG TPA: Rpn9 C-terminal helix [Bacteriophage sp.]
MNFLSAKQLQTGLVWKVLENKTRNVLTKKQIAGIAERIIKQ